LKIGTIDFNFISFITPERDIYGKVREYSPSSRYLNRNGLPLNKWGQGPFCRFRIENDRSLNLFGVYAIVGKSNEVYYIGKCTGPTSTLAKRFNNGYSIISPRNCFQGGQSTNCHVNHLILEATSIDNTLSLFFFMTETGTEASDLEAELIGDIGKPL
jgi:hypothetical protein